MDRSWWNEHSICKIGKKKLFVRENFFIFGIVFEKIGFLCFFFFGYLFLKFKKNRNQKLSMLEKNTRTDLESALNSKQSYEAKFLNIVLLFLWSKIFRQKNIFSKNTDVFLHLTCNKKKWLKKLKNRFHNSCENTFYRRAIYVNKCIYWVLLLCLEAINASNQGTICSCMIFQASCFILYFIFPMKLDVFYALFYNDVTTLYDFDRSHFLTDLNENCTAYVKLKIKDILFVRIFWFSQYLWRKLRLITKITSIFQLPYTSPPSPLGRPLGWVLLGTHLWHTSG